MRLFLNSNAILIFLYLDSPYKTVAEKEE